ncbi:hypothetical protein M433DRAFT_20741 [Acidomyces richmondensis BFW]|nr:MAG: hypothetical protein FE78DRAFT_96391 [Acidomyces sp. 'richmondensis']KYG50318.1 hypothetical protein M433DRAFT_20741 [Acidomyces richmondensis BFW]
MSQALKCWSEIMTWKNQSASWYNANIAGRSWPMTTWTTLQQAPIFWTSTYYPANVSTYKLCDGSPRVNIRPKTVSGVSNTTYYPAATFSSLVTPTFQPQPCKPSPEDCQLWYEDSNIPLRNNYELLTLCGYPAHLNQSCIFGVSGAVQLYYFPVTTINGSLCSKVHPTIPASPTGTGPNIVTRDGHIFTSGTVYLSIQSLFATYDGFGNTIGPTFRDIFIPLKSDEISTQCSGDYTNTPLTYADLNWPVPASAYKCQDRCSVQSLMGHVPPQCNTIWSDVNPDLAIPTKKLMAMVPEWSSCAAGDGNQRDYFFDPPVALQQQPLIATVTVPTQPTSTPAAPSASLHSPGPAVTSSTLMSALPTTETETKESAKSMPSNPLIDFTPTSFYLSSSLSSGVGATIKFTSVASDAQLTSTTDGNAESVQRTLLSNSDATQPTAAVISILSAALSSLEAGSTTSTGFQSSLGDTATSPELITTAMTGNILSIGSTSLTMIRASSHIIVGSQSLIAGEETTLSGIIISVGSSNVIVDPNTLTASGLLQPTNSASPQPTVLAAGSVTITVSSISGHPSMIAVDGATLSIGAPALTADGQVLSEGSNGIDLLNSGAASPTEYPLPLIATAPAGSVLTANGVTVTASYVSGQSDLAVIDGTALSAGGSPATMADGKTVSLASNGLVLLVSPTPQVFVPISGAQSRSGSRLVLGFGSLTITAEVGLGTANAASFDGTTLSAGGFPISIDGVTLSKGSSGLVMLGRNTTVALSTIAPVLPGNLSSGQLPVITTVQSSVTGQRTSPTRPSSTSSGAVRLTSDWEILLIPWLTALLTALSWSPLLS